LFFWWTKYSSEANSWKTGYTISFSTAYSGLIFDVDIVEKALLENLGRITDSIRYLAQQALYQAEKDALIEAEKNLAQIKKEISKWKERNNGRI